ncbi:unnamed protein product [Sphenostylis stenocarpa]|uniref:Uncharacterized protein n=1 Tax=Sphenostylis stenocarpa TaxID=92480 RepID=A0AA86SEY7_9FABA|nr:unnamed protein product [Sphenostylis stenocarpa]
MALADDPSRKLVKVLLLKGKVAPLNFLVQWKHKNKDVYDPMMLFKFASTFQRLFVWVVVMSALACGFL